MPDATITDCIYVEPYRPLYQGLNNHRLIFTYKIGPGERSVTIDSRIYGACDADIDHN